MIAKALIAVAVAATAFVAYAGEDSTHRLGAGGTGANFWDVPGGLKAFAQAQSDAPRGEAAAGMSAQEHAKCMDEMMARMKAEHGAMMGAPGAGSEPESMHHGK